MQCWLLGGGGVVLAVGKELEGRGWCGWQNVAGARRNSSYGWVPQGWRIGVGHIGSVHCREGNAGVVASFRREAS